MRTLVIALGLAAGGTARADQCQLVDNDVAEWAPKLLAKGVSFVSQCEPCGDKGPSQPKQVTSIAVRASHGANQVAVNGKDIDLAYVFVQTGKLTYTNAALLLGCPTQGVSTSVMLKPATHKWSARLPQSCHEYERSVAHLTACDKLPQATRDVLKQVFDSMAQTFEGLDAQPADAITALGDACKAGVDALRQAASAAGCQL